MSVADLPRRDYDRDRSMWDVHPWRDDLSGRHFTEMYDLVVMLTHVEPERRVDNTWAFNIHHPVKGYVWRGSTAHKTLAAAKAAAFDALVYADRWTAKIAAGEDCSAALRSWANTRGLVRG